MLLNSYGRTKDTKNSSETNSGHFLDDREITELIISRREEGLEAAISKYGRLCFSIAAEILKNQSDIEECLDDVWIRLWNSVEHEKGESLVGFLVKTTRNRAIDMFRKSRRKKNMLNSINIALSDVDNFMPSNVNVEETVMRNMIMEKIESYLQGRDPLERVAFIKRYVLVESVSSISSELGQPYFKVYFLLKKMIKEIRIMLNGGEYDG